MTEDEAVELGQQCKDDPGNPLISSFAGDLIDAGYPLSAEMAATVFRAWRPADLGRRFAEWIDTP